MKRFFSISLILVCLAAPCAMAHSHGRPMWGGLENLPAVLHLTPAQISHYNAYWKDMDAAMRKDHQAAEKALQEVLTPQQWCQLMNDMGSMKKHHAKSDEEMKAMVDQEATKLLLTSNQAAQFGVIVMTLYHQKKELESAFLSRLARVLTPAQQKMLAAWRKGMN